MDPKGRGVIADTEGHNVPDRRSASVRRQVPLGDKLGVGLGRLRTTHGLHSSSFLGLYRVLNINHKKELLWVYP